MRFGGFSALNVEHLPALDRQGICDEGAVAAPP